MKYCKIKDGVVVQVQPYPGDGFIECPEGTIYGMVDDGLGGFSATSPAINYARSRDDELSNLVHDFGDGRVIQCRPHPFGDESLMRNAIQKMVRDGLAQTTWYAADNTPVLVTPNDLEVVIDSGQDQAAIVWQKFFAAINQQ